MTAKEKNTEKKILEAAHRVFLKKGMSGARMQEIADEASINKALLHYYFKNKEMLFTAVFRLALGQFIPRVQSVLDEDKPFEDKLLEISSKYHDMLITNPYLPGFILQEVNRDPTKLVVQFLDIGLEPATILTAIQKELEIYLGFKVDPRHFVLSLLSMVIFPILSMPMMCGLFFDSDKEAYQEFLEQRKLLVPKMLLGGVKNMAVELKAMQHNK